MATKKVHDLARKVESAGRPAPANSPVGDEITRHLRALQAERREELDLDAVVGALVPAVAALAGRGLLVSITRSLDARSVRLSALIDKEWIAWFSADHEEAAALADAIVVSLGT